MKQQDFEQLHTERWQQLETYIEEYQQRKEPPGKQFPELYRQVCSHLSLARQRHYSQTIINRLNTMVMTGHHMLYEQDNRPSLRSLIAVIWQFPVSLRQNSTYLLVSTLLFVVPGLLMGLACYLDDSIIYSVMDINQVRNMELMYDPEARKLGRERESDTDLMMFGHYIHNNIGIAFRTFAGGIFFGLGSIFFLVFNGVIIGAVAGRLTVIGFYTTFYPFVIGHGAFELTAIVFSGAAGLMIGHSVIAPGNISRLEALKKSARSAVKIMYGAALMLFIAAFIEAFWSSSNEIPVAVRLSVGTLLWLFVIWFCFLSRNGRANES